MDEALPLQGLLQSLGWAILHSFWQMALAWLVYQLFFGWRSRLTPTLRHNAALLLLTAGTIWFMVTFVHEYTKFRQVDRYLAMLPETGPGAMALSTSEPGLAGLQAMLTGFTEQHIAYLSTLYLLALCCMAWRLLFGFLQAKALRTHGLVDAGPELEATVASLARRLAIPQSVRVHISRMVDVPATLGFLKPVILLPMASLTQLTPAQLESILLHELAHIRRMDYLLNIGVSMMETLMFHNPFAWLLVRSVRSERELCCDDIVLSCRQDVLEYASALLSLEKSRSMPSLSMALASNGRKGQLLHRVRRMTNVPGVSRPYADRLVALSLMCLLMVSMAWIKPGTTQAHTRKIVQPARLVQDQTTWVLNEPVPNTPDKPRRQPASSKQVLKGKGNNTVENIETVLISQSDDPLPPPSASAGTMVFVNQPPPDGFQFEFDMEATPGIITPAMPGFQPPRTGMELDMLREITRQRMDKARQLREMDIQIRERMEESRNSIFHRQVEAAPDMIADEYQKAADHYTRRQYAPVPNPRAPRAAAKAPLVIRPEASTQFLFDQKDIIELAGEDNQELIQLLRKAVAPSVAQVGEPVKVNRVKTRQGYMLRIETGKESIDIRIGENDIIVENRLPE